MKAKLLRHEKRVFDDGAILEMRLWEVAEPVMGSSHRLKYSLFYGRPGERLIGYDNERGKGDHRHFEGDQEQYAFASARQLIADFLSDVDRVRRTE